MQMSHFYVLNLLHTKNHVKIYLTNEEAVYYDL